MVALKWRVEMMLISCSQGGQLVHNAAKLLSSATQAMVNSGTFPCSNLQVKD